MPSQLPPGSPGEAVGREGGGGRVKEGRSIRRGDRIECYCWYCAILRHDEFVGLQSYKQEQQFKSAVRGRMERDVFDVFG